MLDPKLIAVINDSHSKPPKAWQSSTSDFVASVSGSHSQRSVAHSAGGGCGDYCAWPNKLTTQSGEVR
jgi:hypothetical protein